MNNMLQAAKAAKAEISQLTTEEKNAALLAMADSLIQNQAAILAANEKDLSDAANTISTVIS